LKKYRSINIWFGKGLAKGTDMIIEEKPVTDDRI